MRRSDTGEEFVVEVATFLWEVNVYASGSASTVDRAVEMCRWDVDRTKLLDADEKAAALVILDRMAGRG